MVAPAGSFYAIEASRWLGLGDTGGLPEVRGDRLGDVAGRAARPLRQLHGDVGFAVAFAADRPGVHLLGDMAEGRHFADLVQVLYRRVIGGDRGRGVEGHRRCSLQSCRNAESRRSCGQS